VPISTISRQQYSSTKVFHSLNVLSLNANSLHNKIDELKLLTAASKPDIIAVTETHLSDSVDSSSVCIDGYKLYRRDRMAGIHGGVAIYIKSDIPSYELHSNCDPGGEWESIWCCVKPKNSTNLKIGCCYRIPSSVMPDHWPGFLSMLNFSLGSLPKAPTLLLGDYNFPTIDWGKQLTTQSEASASYEFLDFFA